MIESKLNTINYLTESEYEAAKTANNINENELYITPDFSSEIEMNTNGNGTYIKFPNGLLICTGKKDSGLITWIADNNHFVASNIGFNDFPHQFISEPIVTKGLQRNSPTDTRYMALSGGRGPTATNPGSFNVLNYANTTGTSVTASYIAVGRWK